MTLTAADRQTVESNRADYEKMTSKGLSDLLIEGKVPGRSKVKTRDEKIELLMAQTWGYQEAKAEAAPEPEATPELENTATAETLKIDPAAACASLSDWIVTKQRHPRAIVMVVDVNDPRCAVTYAGDALLLNRLFYTELTHTYFGGTTSIARCRISQGSTSAFALRLKDKGIELVKNY